MKRNLLTRVWLKSHKQCDHMGEIICLIFGHLQQWKIAQKHLKTKHILKIAKDFKIIAKVAKFDQILSHWS